jgi:hypothetical protein
MAALAKKRSLCLAALRRDTTASCEQTKMFCRAIFVALALLLAFACLEVAVMAYVAFLILGADPAACTALAQDEKRKHTPKREEKEEMRSFSHGRSFPVWIRNPFALSTLDPSRDTQSLKKKEDEPSALCVFSQGHCVFRAGGSWRERNGKGEREGLLLRRGCDSPAPVFIR